MKRSPVLVVAHETDQAGVDCLVASTLAELFDNSMTLWRIGSQAAKFPAPGSAEHVTTTGPLQPNGVYWLERTGHPVEASNRLLDRDAAKAVVVSINPLLLEDGTMAEVRGWVADRAAWLTVTTTETGYEVFVGAPEDGNRLVRTPLRRDGFGRLPPLGRDNLVPQASEAIGLRFSALRRPVMAVPAEQSLRLVVVGARAHLVDVYPAVLASLGDAADQLGIGLQVHCVSGREAAASGWGEVLKEADGLVLPGGSDMFQVKGQIAAAASALDIDLPTLGLCLGMQTMTTAFLRHIPAASEADLEETAPDSPLHSFIRLRDASGEPVHYLGERAIAVQPKTRLSTLYGGLHAVERLNHRYQLAPEFIPILEEHGLLVTATTGDTGVAQGIEAPGHRFFVGIQGHPELRSRRSNPHPVILGFLSAAKHKALSA